MSDFRRRLARLEQHHEGRDGCPVCYGRFVVRRADAPAPPPCPACERPPLTFVTRRVAAAARD